MFGSGGICAGMVGVELFVDGGLMGHCGGVVFIGINAGLPGIGYALLCMSSGS